MPQNFNFNFKQLLPVDWLPKSWEEKERYGGENNVALAINHFNPAIEAHPIYSKSGTISSSPDGKEITVARGSEILQQGGPKDVLDLFNALFKAGYLSPIEHTKVTESLKEGFRISSGPEFEKFDFSAEIVVSQFPDEETAKFQFEDYLFPGKMLSLITSEASEGIPGIPKGMSIKDLLKSDVWRSQAKKMLSEEQLKQIEKFYKEQLPELHLKVEKIRQEVEKEREKTGVKGFKIKYLGCEAIYLGRQRTNSKMCVAILAAKRYIISGRFLWYLNLLPSGNIPCDSLTKFETKTTTERIEGETFIRHEIIPVKSTLTQEGYLNKEECENILKTVLQVVEKLT